MQSLTESVQGPEPQPPDNPAAHHSEQGRPESSIPGTQALPPEDQPTTSEAVLRILTAVENISSQCHWDKDVLPRVGRPGPQQAPPSHSGLESIVNQDEPHIKRMLMSQWNNPYALLKSLRGAGIVATAFYTDLPESVNPADDNESDADFKAAYSKDKWSSGPQRILIHHRRFINDLRQIFGVPDTQRTGVLSMVPPFKYLIHHRDAIKSKLDELKEAASSHEPTAVASTDNSMKRSSIKYFQCLHDFIRTDLANYIGLELRIRDGDMSEVLFQETYHLFRPGDLVLAAESGENQIYQVYSVTGGRMLLSTRSRTRSELSGGHPPQRTMDTRAGTWMDLRIVCFSMGWDGENIGPRKKIYDLPYFSGMRLITDLDLYPIRFQSSSDELRERLCARGCKLIQCIGHKKYTGTAVEPHESLQMFLDRRIVQPPVSFGSHGTEVEANKSSPSETVRGDVYIDYKGLYANYFRTFPLLSLVPRLPGEDAEAIDTLSDGKIWNCSDRDVDSTRSEIFYHANRHLIGFSKPKDITEDKDRVLLLPGQVPAFVFSMRKWEWLDLDNMEDIDKSEASRNSGWKELVIPHKFSELLLSLVSNHISDVCVRQGEPSAQNDSTVQIDLVRGKGRGLIILLHGPPGSGKTSTAETIAAYTGRPLYSITCGDLGTSPKELENNLVRHSRLAEQWGCVLLLDEADVFLMSRNYHNLHRNAMVSIFLRQLEYYSGILFLTTNIVGVIDEAFKSRIHVALEYPAIDEESTLEIWKNTLQRINRDNAEAEIKIRFDEGALLQFAKRHYRNHRLNGTSWNGRQIRNAFQTAIGIGQFERLKKIDEAETNGDRPDRSTRYIKLSVASFATVAETTSDFERYITKTRGNDRDRAAAHEFRHDEHSREPPLRKSYHTHAGSYRAEADIGPSRAGRSKMTERRHQRASSSPAPKRTEKGKETRRRPAPASTIVSDSDDLTGEDEVYRSGGDEGTDEEIIEEDIGDDDGDGDEAM